MARSASALVSESADGTTSHASARDDAAYMQRALELARKGWGHTAPNPMVGAVVVRDGHVVGVDPYGGIHAHAGDAGPIGRDAGPDHGDPLRGIP